MASMVKWGHHIATYRSILMVGMTSLSALNSSTSIFQKSIIPCITLPAKVFMNDFTDICVYTDFGPIHIVVHRLPPTHKTPSSSNAFQSERALGPLSLPSSRNLNNRPLIPPPPHNKIPKQTRNYLPQQQRYDSSPLASGHAQVANS